MLSIINVAYLEDYRLQLTFNNGKIGIVDLKDIIFNDKRKPFMELQIKSQFKQFEIAHDTLVWKNGLDLAPEFLFFIAFKKDKDWQEKFRQWGYITRNSSDG